MDGRHLFSFLVYRLVHWNGFNKIQFIHMIQVLFFARIKIVPLEETQGWLSVR